MSQKVVKISLLAILLISYAFSTLAQPGIERVHWNNGVRNWELFLLSNEEAIELSKRWEAIGESLKTRTNIIEGTYHKGSIFSGYYLRWSVEKGFIYVPYYDETIVCPFAYGKVTVTDSEIILIPEREIVHIPRCRSYMKTPTIWIPANDGEYLVPKDEIGDFGDFYGGLGKFNGYPINWDANLFASRVEEKGGDLSKTSFVVPEKYLKFIKQPIKAEITKVGRKRISQEFLLPNAKNEISVTDVTVNVGKKDGVTRDFIFLLKDNCYGIAQFLQITCAGEKQSQGVVIRDTDKTGNEACSINLENSTYEPFSPLKIGTKVMTSLRQTHYRKIFNAFALGPSHLR